jgi:hypothetical protein
MSNDTPDSLIPYDEIVQETLRAVVGRVLAPINSNLDLLGDHHFYITFNTMAAGVSIPRSLMERFPDEMTIVLQNKFWDLKVHDDGFEVGLTFSGIPSHLHVPFAAITQFVDPAVNFALQFNAVIDDEPADTKETEKPVATSEDGSNVVSVDFGRKK